MAYTIKTPLGKITYYDNYGFPCIAQMVDEDGAMFANYTEERIKLTPNDSLIVAIWRRKCCVVTNG